MLFLWLKAFHLMAVVCWFAGLFYLPRLFAICNTRNVRAHIPCYLCQPLPIRSACAYQKSYFFRSFQKGLRGQYPSGRFDYRRIQ